MAWSVVGSASGGDTSIELSAIGALASGDVAAVCNWGRRADPAVPTDVTPSGFTTGVHGSGLSSTIQWRGRISAKVLDGTETTVSGIDGSGQQFWIAVVFRPDVTVTALATAGTPGSQVTTGDPTLQTIAVSGVGAPVLLLGQMFTTGAAITPRSTSPTMTEIAGTSTAHYAHHFVYASGDTPANHTYDTADVGAFNGMQSCYFTFTVASSGHPPAKRTGGVPYMRQNSGLWAPMFRGLAAA